jgi:hypothetical protein
VKDHYLETPPEDDLTSLAFWLEGSRLVQAANRVSQWSDSIGTYNFTEAVGANQPLYTAALAAFNNRPGVTFDNTDTRLRAGSSTSLRHVFIVGYYPNATFGGVRLLMQRNPGGAGHHLFRSLSDEKWRTGDQVGGNHYRNGTQTDTALATGGVPQIWEFQCTASEAGTWHLGDDVTLTGRQFQGTIAEVRAYTTLKSGSNLAKIRARLAYDYGITL